MFFRVGHFTCSFLGPNLTEVSPHAVFCFSLSLFFSLILLAYPERTQPGSLTSLSLKPLFAEPRRERGRRADANLFLDVP